MIAFLVSDRIKWHLVYSKAKAAKAYMRTILRDLGK